MGRRAKRKRNRRRSWLRRVVLVLVVLFVITLVFLPQLVGTRVGRAFIESRINSSNPSMVVTIGELDLSWTGGQRIEHLHVEQTGTNAWVADLSVRADGSLLSWAMGSLAFGEVFVSGQVNVSGPKGGQTAGGAGESSGRSGEAMRLPAGLQGTLVLDGLDVLYEDSGVAGTVQVQNLTGEVSLDEYGSVVVDIEGASEIRGKTGEFKVYVDSSDLVGVGGLVELSGATFRGGIQAENFPVGLVDALVGLDGVLVSSVGDGVDVDVAWGGTLRSGSGEVRVVSSSIDADLIVHAANGQLWISEPGVVKWHAEPEAVATLMKLVGEDVPVSIESAVDMEFVIKSFETPHTREGFDLPGNVVTIDVRGEAIDFRLVDGLAGEEARDCVLDDWTLAIKSEDVTRLIDVRYTSAIELAGDRVPLDGRFVVRRLFDPQERSFDARVVSDGIPIGLAGLWLDDETVEMCREAMGGGELVRLRAESTMGDGGPIGPTFVGLAGNGTTIELTGREVDDGVKVSMSSTVWVTPSLIEMVKPDDSTLSLVEPVMMNVSLERVLIPRIREGAAGEIGSIDWANGWKSAQLEVKTNSRSGIELTGVPGVEHSVGLDDLSVGATAIDGLEGSLTLEGSSLVRDAEAGVQVGRVDVSEVEFGPMVGEGTGPVFTGGTLVVKEANVDAVEQLIGLADGTVGAWVGDRGELSVQIEPKDAASDNEWRVSCDAKYDRGHARFDGTLTPDRFVLDRTDRRGLIVAEVDRERVEPWLNRSAMVEKMNTSLRSAEQSVEEWRVSQDPRVSVILEQLNVPFDAFTADSFDPTLIEVDARASVDMVTLSRWTNDGRGGEWEMSKERDEWLQLYQIKMIAKNRPSRDAIDASLSGWIMSPESDEEKAERLEREGPKGANSFRWVSTGELDLTGVYWLRDASLNDGRPDRRASGLDVSGVIKGVPMNLVDSIAGLDGWLISAIGPTADAAVDVVNLRPDQCWGQVIVKSPNLQVKAEGLEWRDGVVSSNQPLAVEFEVTRAMSEHLLKNINPMLYDVQKTSGPIALGVTQFSLPTNGDWSLLNADFVLELGQVYVAKSGLVGDLLGTLFDEFSVEIPEEMAAALVPPINVQINQGIVHYDQLVLQADRFNITTGGNVDLVNRELDLLATVPLIGWSQVFGDMTGVGGSDLPMLNRLEIPFHLVVTGSIDDPEIKPDPKGAQRVADDFFRAVIEDTVKGVFEGLFKGLGG